LRIDSVATNLPWAYVETSAGWTRLHGCFQVFAFIPEWEEVVTLLAPYFSSNT